MFCSEGTQGHVLLKTSLKAGLLVIYWLAKRLLNSQTEMLRVVWSTQQPRTDVSNLPQGVTLSLQSKQSLHTNVCSDDHVTIFARDKRLGLVDIGPGGFGSRQRLIRLQHHLLLHPTCFFLWSQYSYGLLDEI